MGFLTDLASKYLGADSDDKGAPEVQDVSSQPLEDIQLAAFIKRKVEEVRSSANRISHEGIWMTNIAYALGYDSVYYDTASRQYKPVGSAFGYPKRNRTHDNQILPAMQNRLARLCKNPPRWETRPEDDTPEAKECAALDYDVALDLWERLQLDEKDIELKMWLQQCGHAYMVASWDEDAGEDMVDPSTGQFVGFEGDTTAEVASPFEFFADTKAKNLRDAKWVVRAKVRELDYFRDRYPRGNLVKEEDAWLLSTQYELRINSLNASGPQSGGGATQTQMKNSAIELAYYERRSRKFPKGRMCIVANGVLLENKALPIGKYPFVKFDDIKVAGKFYPEAAVTHARPLQDQYNRNLARTSEWINKLTAGKWRAPKGSGLSEEALNDRTEVVEYNPVPNAAPPEAMQVPVIPAHIYKEREDLKSGLYEKFGLSEVSRGHMPSAGIPAVGMQLLVEQDETRISIEVRSHENSWAEFMNVLVEYEGTFRQMPRRLKKKTDNGYSIRSYTGEMLSKKPDVRVIRGSTIPQSRSLRRQEILNSYQQGLLGNPADPVIRQKVWAALESGDLPDTWKEVRLDMAQVNGVMDQIMGGETPSFNKLDNHALHCYMLNSFRKERGKDLSPEQLSLVEFLIDQHAKAATEFADPALSAKLENVQNGLMPDGSGPDQIMEAQVRGAAVGEANDNAFHASQPEMPAPAPAGVPV